MSVTLGSKIARQKTNDERFYEKIRKRLVPNDRVGTPCWEWTAALSDKGYGRFAVQEWMGGGRCQIRAHHYLWCLKKNRKVKSGYTLDHLCRNTRCVRPSHLEEVTVTVNAQRRIQDAGNPNQNASKTHCKHRHEFSKENTRFKTGRNGKLARDCRTCEQDRYLARKVS